MNGLVAVCESPAVSKRFLIVYSRLRERVAVKDGDLFFFLVHCISLYPPPPPPRNFLWIAAGAVIFKLGKETLAQSHQRNVDWGPRDDFPEKIFPLFLPKIQNSKIWVDCFWKIS